MEGQLIKAATCPNDKRELIIYPFHVSSFDASLDREHKYVHERTWTKHHGQHTSYYILIPKHAKGQTIAKGCQEIWFASLVEALFWWRWFSAKKRVLRRHGPRLSSDYMSRVKSKFARLSDSAGIQVCNAAINRFLSCHAKDVCVGNVISELDKRCSWRL